ncbi:MAG TPA: SRPBCC family protein, partial [Stellaceae bacterium]|nr:SRPBCC family protein [Stellaceae bacterium]
TCPYHQWTYGLDGRLLSAPQMQAGFDRSAYGLGAVHIETVAGLIFICLAENPPPFEQCRADLEPVLAPHDLLNGKIAVTLDVVERANWKLVMENARECYHCAARHPDLRASFPVAYFAAQSDKDKARATAFRSRMAAFGMPTGPYEGEWWQVERFPLNEGAVSISLDGQAVSRRLLCAVADGDVGSVRISIEPHSFAHAVGDHVLTFSAMPTGPEETVVRMKFLVHKDAVEGVDYDRQRLIETWNRTNDQDRDLAETNQRGVNSIGYRPGPYSEDAEKNAIRIANWYCEKAWRYIEARRPGDGGVPALSLTEAGVRAARA